MAAQRKAEANPVSDFFKEHAAEGAITATQLTDLIGQVTGVDRDPKTVRATLRRMKARDQAQFKGAQWKIDEQVATDTLTHFAQAKKVVNAES